MGGRVPGEQQRPSPQTALLPHLAHKEVRKPSEGEGFSLLYPLRERHVCRPPVICAIPILNFSRYPKLGTQHPESNSAGNDVFAKFSAFIKNTKKDANESEYLPSTCSMLSTWGAPRPLVWLLLRSWEF